ncbi:MAG: F0F1 ATP synthase subunit B [Anaerorhabdus sp.]
MIDIDIAQQLFPNPLTILIQLTSTGILLFFIRKYLWSAARDLMQKRSDVVHAKMVEAQENLDDAKKSADSAKNEIDIARSKAIDIVAKAETDAKEVSNSIVLKAQKDAELKLEKARDEIKIEKNQMREEVVSQMIDVAMSATEKLIGDKVDTQSDKQSIEKFVKEMSKSV